MTNAMVLRGESDAYRSARNKLLEAEKGLRRKVAAVAELRSQLPLGRELTNDYVFERLDSNDTATQVQLSELFQNSAQSLVVYSFMFDTGAAPCPMCTAFLDSFNGAVRQVADVLQHAVVAKAPIAQVQAWANERGWDRLNILSSANTDFNHDYFAEDANGSQVPMLTVFKKSGDSVHHFYSTELYYTEPEPNQHPRHMDMLFPLWNLFDLTPEGRPNQWFPSIDR